MEDARGFTATCRVGKGETGEGKERKIIIDIETNLKCKNKRIKESGGTK